MLRSNNNQSFGKKFFSQNYLRLFSKMLGLRLKNNLMVKSLMVIEYMEKL